MKRLLKILVPVVITCAMAVSAYANEISSADGYIDGMPSPVTEYSKIDELNSALDFDVVSPSVPSNYRLSLISDISGEIAQLIYVDNDSEICYRKAKGNEDISGDYNIYTTVTKLKINGADVKLKGNAGRIYLAMWTKGSYTYSLSFDEGLSLREAERVINTVKF